MHASNAPALLLERVTKTFGDHVAVDDVSLTVPRGTVYGFIGPNGAGKTTTLRMIVDIIRPDAGTITVLGEHDLSKTRGRVGYLPEERGMYKKMRALEFVSYVGTLNGLTPSEARRRASDLMDRYDLGDWKDKSVDALSKGMQQKLQFITTIVHDPELMILDEPFSGLDPVNIELMAEAVRASRNSGHSVIFSTHMMEHAERLCDAILMIHRGRKVLDGPIADIKAAVRDRPIKLTAYGEAGFIATLPYVERVRNFGSDHEVYLRAGTAPHELLKDLVGRLQITRFEVAEASLYDIFLEQVAPGRAHRFASDGSLIAAEDDPLARLKGQSGHVAAAEERT